MTDLDGLPPTQYLIMDVLAARHRTGELSWTFPSGPSYRKAFVALAAAGLVRYRQGNVENTLIGSLTVDGRAAYFRDGNDYASPVEQQLAEARRLVSSYQDVVRDIGGYLP